ncbi:MAG: nickel/cobalt transporter, partial [Dehalococcoidia bacterium]
RAEPEVKSQDILGSLVNADKLTLPVVLVSLIVALGLGALHAVSPGHGKTVMAAYLVGTRGTAKHALFLGLTVTISHTLGVLALGLIVLYASNLVAPERLYPWISLVSGGIIVAIGVWLLLARLRASKETPQTHQDYLEVDPQTRAHPGAEGGGSILSRLDKRARKAGTKALHGHPHPHGHVHSHGLPAGSDRLRITWRSLTALGVVGGLLPSTSALIILLAAISLQRVGFGILLIVAFSAGMAAVLAGVGLMLVYAGRMVERVQSGNPLVGAFSRLLPTTTALVILVSGMVVATRAGFQAGLL